MNIVRFLWRTGGAWGRSVALFDRVTRSGRYALVVGDETYELAVALHLLKRLRRAPFVMLYDFVGLDATTDDLRERLTVHLFNRVWGGGRHGHKPAADRTILIGELDDVPDRPFGRGLPNRRDYARRYYDTVGYVLGFDPAEVADRTALRRRLGYGEEPVIVVAVGGTGVGRGLLELAAGAHAGIRAARPDARMVLVGGPRIDVGHLASRPGVEVHGYVPRLYEHLAAADVAVVQGGGTTTLELTALRRPFVFFPLEGHCEQEIAVAGRLARHRAGRRMPSSQTSAEDLAAVVLELLGTAADWPSIRADGARRAAEVLASELPPAEAPAPDRARPSAAPA
jgi:hypothetical protein